MDPRRTFSFDWLLIALTLLLLGLGLLMIASATASMHTADVPIHDLPVVRQGIRAALGLLALVVASLINYRVWGKGRWALYAAMLALLAAVLVAGRTNFGARSWFDLQTFEVQPSELAKVILIVFLARYFADHEAQVRQGTGVIGSLLLTLPILALIYAQPDLGMAAVVAAIWLGMLFVAGVRPQHIALMAIAAVVLAPLMWAVLPGHARGRIEMFFDPHTDPLGKDYNVIQALIAVGSGGLWGKGLGLGSQSQLFFLRVRHTDYIFAVLAEELGFVGSILLLTLFAALLLRILQVGARAGDAYGRLLASGVAIMLFVQVAINIGFHVGLLPVTGLPLPLISYGGSSVVTTLIALGLVHSVVLHQQPNDTT